MIKTLVKALKKDESYRYSWQANIAMSFYDEVRRNKDICKVSHKNLHKISNEAAKHFINLLIRDTE